MHTLSLGLRHIILVPTLLDRHCRFWISLRDDFETSTSFAVKSCQDSRPASPPLWNTRVLGVRVKQVCDTCFANVCTAESCLVKAPASHADESVQVMSDLKCASVQEETTGNVRVKCAHAGKRSTSQSVREQTRNEVSQYIGNGASLQLKFGFESRNVSKVSSKCRKCRKCHK